MKTISNIFLFFITITTLTFIGCDSEPVDKYNLKKRYWDEKDYENTLSLIKYYTPNTEKLPGYSTPEKTPIFLKLIDDNNFKVIMDDKALGIKHRSEFSKAMWDNYTDLVEIYQVLDNRDKFIYPKELAEVLNLGLEFQMSYFKLHLEKIKQDADDPNSEEIKKLLRDNEQILVNNFTLRLDFVKHEQAFTDEALKIYVEGINNNFKQLITEFPDADYSEMLSKVNLMQQKAQTIIVKNMLTNLATIIDSNIKNKAK